jgi:hypothetical protein
MTDCQLAFYSLDFLAKSRTFASGFVQHSTTLNRGRNSFFNLVACQGLISFGCLQFKKTKNYTSVTRARNYSGIVIFERMAFH